MILGVVLVHCNLLPYIDNGAASPVTACVIDLFSSKLPEMCVPFFFFISAYLLQTKHPVLLRAGYVGLIRKRARTILLAYLLWNTITVLLRTAVNLSPLGRYASGGHDFESVAGWLLDVYWVPELIPLWFLRNLMGFILIAPLLQQILRRSPAFLLLMTYLVEIYTSIGGILYYASGMVAAYLCTPRRFEYRIGRMWALAPVYCLFSVWMVLFPWDASLEPVYPLIKIMGFLGFMSVCSRPFPLSVRFGSPGAIFFVYAVHGIISPYVLKGLVMLCPWDGEAWLVVYMLSFVIVTGLSYVSYICCCRWTPCLSALLTGNRSAVRRIPDTDMPGR